MVPTEALAKIFARFHAGVLGTRKLSQQRCLEHPGAASGIQNPLYRKADVVRVSGNQAGPVACFDASGDGRARVEVKALVISTVEGHGTSLVAMAAGSRARPYSKRRTGRQSPQASPARCSRNGDTSSKEPSL